MTELNQKVAEYARKLNGITYPEWKQLVLAINFGFREKIGNLERTVEIAIDGDVIVDDKFTFQGGGFPPKNQNPVT